MRSWLPLFLLFLLAVAGRAGADQNDPGLDKLFAGLKAAPDIHSAAEIEHEIWRTWLKTDDQAVTLLMDQGMAAMRHQSNRQALRAFEQVVVLAPDYAEGWNKLATVHYLLGDYQDSLAEISRTLELEPRHFGALSGRGLVYLALEDERRALESFEEALKIHPNAPGTRSNAEMLKRQLHDQAI